MVCGMPPCLTHDRKGRADSHSAGLTLECVLLTTPSAVPTSTVPPEFTPKATNSNAYRLPAGNNQGKLGCVRSRVLRAHPVIKRRACSVKPLLETLFRLNKTGPPGPRATTPGSEHSSQGGLREFSDTPRKHDRVTLLLRAPSRASPSPRIRSQLLGLAQGQRATELSRSGASVSSPSSNPSTPHTHPLDTSRPLPPWSLPPGQSSLPAHFLKDSAHSNTASLVLLLLPLQPQIRKPDSACPISPLPCLPSSP